MTPAPPPGSSPALYKYVGIDGLRRTLEGSIRFTHLEGLPRSRGRAPFLNGTGATLLTGGYNRFAPNVSYRKLYSDINLLVSVFAFDASRIFR